MLEDSIEADSDSQELHQVLNSSQVLGVNLLIGMSALQVLGCKG